MIQVKRMSHVTLETPDLQRQIDYFTQVVGLQEAGRENGTAFLATGRRRSSSSGVGALTIAHTRGSPRLYASNARTSASPSILSVFARRRRRDVAIEAGSTTWLSIPSFCSTRSIQNPSRPAS